MQMGKGGWLVVGGLVLATVAVAGVGSHVLTAAERSQSNSGEQAAASDRLGEADLGNLIRAMGISAKLEEHRFDFSFAAKYNKSDWNLSMSAVLSQDGNAVWVIAWLDQCPKSAAEVPRMALLGLLAKNDTMGNGKFFAWIPSNNRFVLQRVVPNESLTTGKFREILQDVAASVVETYPQWAVANWKKTDHSRQAESAPQKSAPAELATETKRADVERTGSSQ